MRHGFRLSEPGAVRHYADLRPGTSDQEQAHAPACRPTPQHRMNRGSQDAMTRWAANPDASPIPRDRFTAELFVRLHTVKKTSDALYQRLGVHAQGAAVDTDHKLGFLTTPGLVVLHEMARLVS